MARWSVLIACAFAAGPVHVDGFGAALRARTPRRAADVSMAVKDWSKRKTLAEELGHASGGNNFQDSGLIGTVPVEFKQGDAVRSTMALAGQPLSQVAIQAGQVIKYQCRKGECGQCEVKVDGEAVRMCQALVPSSVAAGESYVIDVPVGKIKTKKQSTFFSVRSFFDGFRNNAMGIVGFVRYGSKEKENFQERMSAEQQLKAMVAAKKAARANAQQ